MLTWESQRVSLIDTLNPESLVSTADPISMYHGMTYKFCKDGMHVARLNAKNNETQIAWEISYEYEFPGFHDWDEGARPIVEIFLAQHQRGKTGLDELMAELQVRGYGWLRPEGVQKKLKEIAKRNVRKTRM
jgi:hypothetical protein